MMSRQMRAVWEEAQRIDANLTASDFHPDSLVLIEHEEGTRLEFKSAFLQLYFYPDHCDQGCEHPGQWILVFTEHHGFHVYHRDDLTAWQQYRYVKHELHKDFPGDRYICEACDSTFPECNRDDEGRIFCPYPWCNEENIIPKVRLLTTEELEELQLEQDVERVREMLVDDMRFGERKEGVPSRDEMYHILKARSEELKRNGDAD